MTGAQLALAFLAAIGCALDAASEVPLPSLAILGRASGMSTATDDAAYRKWERLHAVTGGDVQAIEIGKPAHFVGWNLAPGVGPAMVGPAITAAYSDAVEVLRGSDRDRQTITWYVPSRKVWFRALVDHDAVVEIDLVNGSYVAFLGDRGRELFPKLPPKAK